MDGGQWVRAENTAGDDPFETAFTVSADGEHVVEYRSTDSAGNEEPVKSVAFTDPSQFMSMPCGHGAGSCPLNAGSKNIVKSVWVTEKSLSKSPSQTLP